MSDFEVTALPHTAALRRQAMRLARNTADAEDLLQETWIRAWRAWPRYRAEGSCRAWLATILRNAFLSRYQGRVRRSKLNSAYRHERLAAAEVSPPDAGYTDEQAAALEGLAPPYRDALECALQGLHYREIAAELQIPIGTVMSRLSRARQRLRAELAVAA